MAPVPHERRADAPVGPGDDFQLVAIGTRKIYPTPSVVVVDLAGTMVERIGPMVEGTLHDAIEDGVEIGLADQEGVVLLDDETFSAESAPPASALSAHSLPRRACAALGLAPRDRSASAGKVAGGHRRRQRTVAAHPRPTLATNPWARDEGPRPDRSCGPIAVPPRAQHRFAVGWRARFQRVQQQQPPPRRLPPRLTGMGFPTWSFSRRTPLASAIGRAFSAACSTRRLHGFRGRSF